MKKEETNPIAMNLRQYQRAIDFRFPEGVDLREYNRIIYRAWKHHIPIENVRIRLAMEVMKDKGDCNG